MHPHAFGVLLEMGVGVSNPVADWERPNLQVHCRFRLVNAEMAVKALGGGHTVTACA